LGYLLGENGRNEEAVDACGKAIARLQELAEESPSLARPGLARTLDQISSSLLALGRIGEGIQAAQDGAALWRELVASAPERFLPDLASSLNNLGNALNYLGRHPESLPIAQEAVELYRTLAGKAPAAFLPELAFSLSNLGSMWFDLGLPEQGLPLLEEAIRLLLPDFLVDPTMTAQRIAPVARSYQKLVLDAGMEPDSALLEPLRGLLEVSGPTQARSV
jgi:tetratricopeptide (TPR) repeat protein